MKQWKLLHKLLLFCVAGSTCLYVVDKALANFDTRFQAFQNHLESNRESIEVLAVGTSQTATGLDPSYMQVLSLNLAGSNQHFDTDLKLYLNLRKSLPQLRVVVLELSYGHFEMPLERTTRWRKDQFLSYLDINLDHKQDAPFKTIVYSSYPYKSLMRIRNNLVNAYSEDVNEYGYRLNFPNQFEKLEYDDSKIPEMDMTRYEFSDDPQTIVHNSQAFRDLIDTIQKDGKRIVLCKYPLYGKSIQRQIPEITRRRDSTLAQILKSNPDIKLLDLEDDSLSFNIKHFLNHNHLNPSGARIFTRKLDSLVQKLLKEN